MKLQDRADAETANDGVGQEMDQHESIPSDWANQRVLLHVGFGHSATTSLQTQFFAQRPDLFYLGHPNNIAGGFFSFLKYQEDYLHDPKQMFELCRDEIFEHSERAGRPIVVSDELLTDTGEVYYAPRHLPGDLVAARLKQYFPTAKILFTIRNQFDYVRSMYFNLKRNYAFLAGMPIAPFEEWWAGLQTQVRCWYLGNLDYLPLIEVYARLFGRENLLILPLEDLKARGAEAYLESLCRLIGLPLLPGDVKRFGQPQNSRMTVVEERAAELLAGRQCAPILRQALENRALADLLPQAPRTELLFDGTTTRQIQNRVAAGNRRLVQLFGLGLESLGYPI